MTRLTLGLLLTFAPAPALAAGLGEPCEATADCARGLTCEVVGGASCTCPAPASDQFELPPECDCGEAEDIKACVPGPCTADTDCSEGLVCVTFNETCDTPAAPCAPGEACGQPEEPSCAPTTVSVCAPRWALPCEAAADCGAGFECEPVEECSCTGSAPTDPREPDPAPNDFEDSEGAPLPEESCECSPSTDKNYCRLIETPCTTDTDCASGWQCAIMDVSTPCAIPEDGGAPRCAPEPEPTSGHCQPTAWTGWGGTSNGDFEVDTATRTPTDTSTPTSEAGNTDAVASGGGCAGSLPLGLSVSLLPMLLLRRRR